MWWVWVVHLAWRLLRNGIFKVARLGNISVRAIAYFQYFSFVKTGLVSLWTCLPFCSPMMDSCKPTSPLFKLDTKSASVPKHSFTHGRYLERTIITSTISLQPHEQVCTQFIEYGLNQSHFLRTMSSSARKRCESTSAFLASRKFQQD